MFGESFNVPSGDCKIVSPERSDPMDVATKLVACCAGVTEVCGFAMGCCVVVNVPCGSGLLAVLGDKLVMVLVVVLAVVFSGLLVVDVVVLAVESVLDCAVEFTGDWGAF